MRVDPVSHISHRLIKSSSIIDDAFQSICKRNIDKQQSHAEKSYTPLHRLLTHWARDETATILQIVKISFISSPYFNSNFTEPTMA